MLRLTKSMDVAIIAPHVDDSVRDYRKGVNIISSGIVPYFRPIRRTKSVNIKIITAYVDDAIYNSRRGLHPVSGLVAPNHEAIQGAFSRHRPVVYDMLCIIMK